MPTEGGAWTADRRGLGLPAEGGHGLQDEGSLGLPANGGLVRADWRQRA